MTIGESRVNSGGSNICRFLACIGFVPEAGYIVDAYTTPSYVRQHLTMSVQYYQVPPGLADAVDVGRVSTFRLEATVIPASVTFAVCAASLATPRAVSRGARRRPTRAGS